MKITVGRLKTIIQEELNEYGSKMKRKSSKRDEDEESPKEELGSEVRACVAEQTDIILGDLKKVLEKWEEGEYDSDEERWQAYAKDIQGVVGEYETATAVEFGHSKEECDEIHPDQTHEEWEAEKEEKGEEEEEEEGEKEKHDPGFMPGHAHSKSIGSESKAKKSKKKSSSKNFPYESKELEQMVYQKLLKAFSE